VQTVARVAEKLGREPGKEIVGDRLAGRRNPSRGGWQLGYMKDSLIPAPHRLFSLLGEIRKTIPKHFHLWSIFMTTNNESLAGNALRQDTTPHFDNKPIPAEPNYTQKPAGGPVTPKNEPTR
jgi:hypothetical protein